MIKTFAQLVNGEPTKQEPKQPTVDELAEAVVNKLKGEKSADKPEDVETPETKEEEE